MLDMPHVHDENWRAAKVGVEALHDAWNEIQNHKDVHTDDDAKMAIDGMLARMFVLTYDIFDTENGDKLIEYWLEKIRKERAADIDNVRSDPQFTFEPGLAERRAARAENKQRQAKAKSNWTSATPAGLREKLAASRKELIHAISLAEQSGDPQLLAIVDKILALDSETATEEGYSRLISEFIESKSPK